MKFLFVFSLIFCAAYGFRFRDILANHKDISPHNECAGQPNGMRLPHPNCNQFILCDAGQGLILSCRATEPNFNRCDQRCINDPSVCTITDCNGGGNPTPPPPTPPPPTQPPGETTTRFIPPTVPAVCPIPCVEGNLPATCDCIEKWICVSGTCQCSANIPCPITNEVCMAEPNCGGEGGCNDRCVCESPDNCLCDTEIECGFPQAQCAARCGCAGNCNCVDDDPTNCFCNEECSCIEPPLICPFVPTHCVERCGCQERCLCNGNVCVCDPETRCPVRNVFMSRF